MKKMKYLVPVVLVIAVMVFVKPIQSFALDALSIFRVNDVKTLKITIADLQEGMQTVTNLEKEVDGKAVPHQKLVNVITSEKPEVKKLANAGEFHPFKLRLPSEFDSQTPEIAAVDPHSVKFTINVDATNEVLKTLKSPTLSQSLSNVEMSMNIPGAAVAKYKDVILFATQKPAFEAPDAAKNEIMNLVTTSPLIPTNLRQQLAKIDINSNDIYLPVLVGFGKEVDLGGRMGYIYTMSDLKGFTSSLPEDLKMIPKEGDTQHQLTDEQKVKLEEHKATMSAEDTAKMTEAHKMFNQDMPNLDNASVLIWTKDGVIYGLIGNQSDTALAKIARSVH